MEYLADTPSGDPMHYAFEGIGAVWNSATGFWEYNQILDLSCADMREIYNSEIFNCCENESTCSNARLYQSAKVRTNKTRQFVEFDIDIQIGNCYAMFLGSDIEVINLDCRELKNKECKIDKASFMFSYCRKLKRIMGQLVVKQSFSMFINCIELEYVEIKKANESISFASSPKLRLDAILYLINEETAKGPIVVTLHPTVYARAIADAGVQAALAAHPNVSLASA